MPKAKTKTSVPKTGAPSIAPDQKPAAAKGVKVIYRPLSPLDPNVTKWNGVVFYANVPVVLDPAKHFVLTPYHDVIQIDGINKSFERERKVSMIELAKGNPSFQVEGHERAKVHASKRIVPAAGAAWDEANERDMVEPVEWTKGHWTNESETEALI
jgi:hypothetical protein